MEISQLRLLVVEDNEVSRSVLVSMLDGLGVRAVYPYESAEKAVGFMAEQGYKVHMILCDWQMPGMTGIEFLRRIRQTKNDIPFVMITGNTDAESVQAAVANGVSAYITKPYQPKDLANKLSALTKKIRGHTD
ncbi:MAG: response regulator [Alphaproteobacteria bacterium]|jgi:two-component system, chemotaxis family, chemotaxis protein CheY|nr:response regulator [Alphaproteobacteria bacterium]